jgi:hypothetical protein
VWGEKETRLLVEVICSAARAFEVAGRCDAVSRAWQR